MKENKLGIKPIIINALIVALAFIIQYNGVFSIKIGLANPMLILCVSLAFAMFSGELESVIFALITGMITDGAASTPICFNTLTFMLISLAVSLTVHYLFNNNIRSAIAIGIIGSAIYYLIRFAVCIPKQSLENSVGYLLRYALPSVIYTAAFIIPMFFIEKALFQKSRVR